MFMGFIRSVSNFDALSIEETLNRFGSKFGEGSIASAMIDVSFPL